MNNAEKALVYDDCIRQVEILQREVSKIKAEFVGNIPHQAQLRINENEIKIGKLVGRLENLFR